MAVEKATLIFAIDGLLVQAKLAGDTTEPGTPTALAVMAISAAAQTLRALVVEALPEGMDIDACQHPEGARITMALGGGNHVTTCTACDEIIEQG